MTFRGQSIPVVTYDLPQFMRVKPELVYAQSSWTGSGFELGAAGKNRMTFRSRPSSAPNPTPPTGAIGR